jgi:hypothetical protein
MWFSPVCYVTTSKRNKNCHDCIKYARCGLENFWEDICAENFVHTNKDQAILLSKITLWTLGPRIRSHIQLPFIFVNFCEDTYKIVKFLVIRLSVSSDEDLGVVIYVTEHSDCTSVDCTVWGAHGVEWLATGSHWGSETWLSKWTHIYNVLLRAHQKSVKWMACSRLYNIGVQHCLYFLRINQCGLFRARMNWDLSHLLKIG